MSLGTLVDRSTQAWWFLNGLKGSVKTVLHLHWTIVILLASDTARRVHCIGWQVKLDASVQSQSVPSKSCGVTAYSYHHSV